MPGLNDVKGKNPKITLKDGKEYELNFDLNALAELEEAYGSVEAAFEASDRGSIKAVRKVLWAGLLSTTNFTEMEVGALVDADTLKGLTEALGAAVDQDLPSVKEAAEISPN